MSNDRLRRRHLRIALAAAVLALASIACSSPGASPSGPDTPGATSSRGPTANVSPAVESVAPTPGPEGFEFDPESVALHYASRGYACSDPQPSEVAADHTVRSCSLVDDAGRTLVVGLVVDADGEFANAFASVKASASEDFLDPVDALEPLAGFLGAMLGEARGEDHLPWLAGHLGDAYAETTVGELRVATYTPSEMDHSTIYVELGTPDYLTSPTPVTS